MRLTNFTAQRLLYGLKTIDADAETKLDPDVRFKVAVNINRLTPSVQQMERIGQKIEQERVTLNGKVVAVNGTDDLVKLLDAEDDYKLKKLNRDELRLKDNPKIRSDIIASLAPIIRQFDDGEGDEDD